MKIGLRCPQLACPSGYVAVPGNPALGTTAFCVMQFEAKAWADGNGNGIADPTEIDADGCEDTCAICDGTCDMSWESGTRLPAR